MKKVLALILAAAMTATVFAGCNDGSTSSTADDGSSAASPASEDAPRRSPATRIGPARCVSSILHHGHSKRKSPTI